MLTQLRRLLLPETFFVVCALLFGTLMIVLTPPMQTFDEQDHFFRSYQLSEFNLIPDMVSAGPEAVPPKAPGGEWPINVLAFGYDFLYKVRLADAGNEREELQRQLAAYETTKVDYSRMQAAYLPVAGAYSPIPYIPQVLATLAGKIFDMPMLWFYYLGRVLNFLAWLLLIYIAIRIIPVGKWLMAIIALIPVSLFQATTWSADALTNALVFLAVSLFVYYVFREKQLSNQDVAVISVVTVALALCKSAFWPIAFLFWLIPVAKFASRKRYVLSNLVISGSTLLFFAGWFLLIGFTVPYMALVNNPGEAINAQQQLSGILHNPIHFLTVMFAVPYAYLLVGVGILGWREAPIGGLASIIMALTLVWGMLVAATEERAKEYRWLQRVGSLVVLVALFGLTAISLYTTFTPVNAPVINGLQSRYLIAYAVFLVPIIAGAAFVYRKRLAFVQRYAFVVIPAIVFVLSMSIVAIVQRYY